jgi:hypothetical protein
VKPVKLFSAVRKQRTVFALFDLLGLSKYRPSGSRSSLMPQHSLGCDITPPTKPQWSMELSRKGAGTLACVCLFCLKKITFRVNLSIKKYWEDGELSFLAIYWFYIM